MTGLRPDGGGKAAAPASCPPPRRIVVAVSLRGGPAVDQASLDAIRWALRNLAQGQGGKEATIILLHILTKVPTADGKLVPLSAVPKASAETYSKQAVDPLMTQYEIATRAMAKQLTGMDVSPTPFEKAAQARTAAVHRRSALTVHYQEVIRAKARPQVQVGVAKAMCEVVEKGIALKLQELSASALVVGSSKTHFFSSNKGALGKILVRSAPRGCAVYVVRRNDVLMQGQDGVAAIADSVDFASTSANVLTLVDSNKDGDANYLSSPQSPQQGNTPRMALSPEALPPKSGSWLGPSLQHKLDNSNAEPKLESQSAARAAGPDLQVDLTRPVGSGLTAQLAGEETQGAMDVRCSTAEISYDMLPRRLPALAIRIPEMLAADKGGSSSSSIGTPSTSSMEGSGRLPHTPNTVRRRAALAGELPALTYPSQDDAATSAAAGLSPVSGGRRQSPGLSPLKSQGMARTLSHTSSLASITELEEVEPVAAAEGRVASSVVASPPPHIKELYPIKVQYTAPAPLEEEWRPHEPISPTSKPNGSGGDGSGAGGAALCATSFPPPLPILRTRSLPPLAAKARMADSGESGGASHGQSLAGNASHFAVPHHQRNLQPTASSRIHPEGILSDSLPTSSASSPAGSPPKRGMVGWQRPPGKAGQVARHSPPPSSNTSESETSPMVRKTPGFIHGRGLGANLLKRYGGSARRAAKSSPDESPVLNASSAMAPAGIRRAMSLDACFDDPAMSSDAESDLHSEGGGVAGSGSMAGLLTSFLQSGCANLDSWAAFLPTFASLFEENGDLLLGFDDKALREILFQLMRLMVVHSVALRKRAVVAMLLLIRNSFLHLGSISRLKVMLSLTMSEILSKMGLLDRSHSDFLMLELTSGVRRLRHSLLQLGSWDEISASLVECGLANTSLEAVRPGESINRWNWEDVHDLREVQLRVLEAFVEHSRLEMMMSTDSHLQLETLEALAMAYAHVPELHIMWLMHLSNRHIENSSWAEAGQCTLAIAGMMVLATVARKDSPWDKTHVAILVLLCPSLQHLQVAMLDSATAADMEIYGYGASKLNAEAALKYMQMAHDLFVKAELRHFGAYLLELILPVYCASLDEVQVSLMELELSKHYAWLAEQKLHLIPVKDAAYYRVGFYGDQFGVLAFREFIYKEGPEVRLGDIMKKMRAVHEQSSSGSIPLSFLPDSRQVNLDELDPTHCYVQITSVEPLQEESDVTYMSSVAKGEVVYCQAPVRCFVFETPFTKDGKSQGGLENQWKRRTVLRTESSFPCLVNRLRVTSYQLQEFTPVQGAVSMISSRTMALRAELDAQEIAPLPERVQALQRLLQGSVAVQVNSGVMGVCRAFLIPTDGSNSVARSSRTSSGELHELVDSILVFTATCKMALAVHVNLMGMDDQTFHDELVHGFETLTIQMSHFIPELRKASISNGQFEQSLLLERMSVLR
eukprot:SM000188S03833  [mRNA]  locus=s188:199236:208245:- [translate_table: standard]